MSNTAMRYASTPTESLIQPKNWTRMFGTNTAASSFAAVAVSESAPTTSDSTGTFIFSPRGAVSRFVFFGTDAANETFDVKLVAWSQVIVSGGDALWVPTPMGIASVTLGSLTGVSGGTISDSQLFADTITVSSYMIAGNSIISPADDSVASIEINNVGQQMTGVYFDMTGAASGNGIYMNT